MLGRFELKYVVDAEAKQRFLDAITDNLQQDPNGENAVYRVSSLYFDTPDYRAVWEKLDGESIRRKFRLRYYSLATESSASHFGSPPRTVANAFMEIKHRVNNTVYKERTKLTDVGASAILADAKELGRLVHHVPRYKENRQLVDEIQRSANRQILRAATVITYLREAWQGKMNDRLRVTFDSRCQAYSPSAFTEVQTNSGNALLDPNLVIMEVKFDHAIPCWIRDVLAKQHLQLQRFSKYASGILNDNQSAFPALRGSESNVEATQELATDKPQQHPQDKEPLQLIRRQDTSIPLIVPADTTPFDAAPQTQD